MTVTVSDSRLNDRLTMTVTVAVTVAMTVTVTGTVQIIIPGSEGRTSDLGNLR